jgi:peptide deformylase
MSELHLITVPAKNLHEGSEKITDITSQRYRTLVPQMIETMFKEDGVGLAAPQIGINERLIIVNAKKGPMVCFNPVIIKKSWSKPVVHEGCLSVPGYSGTIKRNRKVMVAFFDQTGEKIVLETHGLLAQIFQHEVDHLNGILYVDKAIHVSKLDESNE